VETAADPAWVRVPVEDLLQVGYLGLLKAIMNFDPEVGESLGAYAQPCVSGEIKRHFRDKRWQIRVKRPVQELHLAVRAAAAELTQQLARVPSDAELAAWLEVTEAEVTEARAAEQAVEMEAVRTLVRAASSGHDPQQAAS
jgi:RNA polymerase sigma-B factor